MGQGFQESSRGIVQGGSHSVPSLIRGAALGLFGSGPAHFVCPFSHFRPSARRVTRTNQR
jgi:hypothetical protein